MLRTSWRRRANSLIWSATVSLRGTWLSTNDASIRPLSNQHEGLELRHPHGGTAKYVERPLMDGYRGWFERLAEAFGDRPLDSAMIENVEAFVIDSEVTTPIEFGDLAQSGHPSVVSDGETVYDRPPIIHRLTKEELDAKSDILHPRERGDHTPHPGHGHGPRTYLPKSHPEHGKTYHRPKR